MKPLLFLHLSYMYATHAMNTLTAVMVRDVLGPDALIQLISQWVWILNMKILDTFDDCISDNFWSFPFFFMRSLFSRLPSISFYHTCNIFSSIQLRRNKMLHFIECKWFPTNWATQGHEHQARTISNSMLAYRWLYHSINFCGVRKLITNDQVMLAAY